MLPRLKRRAEFVRAAKGGLHASGPGMAVQAYRRRAGDGPAGGGGAADCIRVGFTTSKKVGNAVTRNRVRRRLREAAEQVLPAEGSPGHDYVLVGRAEAKDRDFADLMADLQASLARIARKAADRRSRKPRRRNEGGA